MQMGAAGEGNHPRPVTDVEDVFSTYLYEGNGSTQTITNGIDLDGEGGLVWIKSRTSASSHVLFDTERGTNRYLRSNTADLEVNNPPYELSAFNSDGFTVGDASGAAATVNGSSTDYASWTFRKAPKFFDVVTYTGNGSGAGFQTINHSLGVVPGFIVVKATSATNTWFSYHRSLGVNSWVSLNESQAVQTNANANWNPTQTTFEADNFFGINSTGVSYVAYLFAHNDGDGEFGADGDQDIIKCGSFPWGSTSGTEVNLGFEPQWILFKAADQAGKNWFIFDAMRGIVTGGFSGDGDAALFPNTSGAENVNTWGVDLTPTGFIAYGNNIASSGNIIYIAIRRGTKVPESGTEVFAVDDRTGASGNLGAYRSGFPVDMAFHKVITSAINPYEIGSRLTQGKSMNTNDTTAESVQSDQQYGYMDGWNNEASASSTKYSWMWKRAPNFFDVVAYSGNDTNNRALEHNLTVAPEMIWVKARNRVDNWILYHKDIGTGKSIYLNSTALPSADGSFPTTPTDNVFYLGAGYQDNGSAYTYIAYLFATLAGVSKVGSYTGNGTSQTIDCGFSAGARFILVKRTDSTGDWYVWDTERGIVAGNDPYLELNTTDAEVTSDDSVDPDATGFIVNQTATTNINVSSAEYIFYAIA
jgi:hypothetical protein